MIANQNAASITVNAVCVPQIVISTRVDPTSGKLLTSARAVLAGARSPTRDNRTRAGCWPAPPPTSSSPT